MRAISRVVLVYIDASKLAKLIATGLRMRASLAQIASGPYYMHVHTSAFGSSAPNRSHTTVIKTCHFNLADINALKPHRA